MKTDKELFLTSIAEKKANGLSDVKFFPGNIFNSDENEVYAELNRMDAADDMADVEVLGSRSI